MIDESLRYKVVFRREVGQTEEIEVVVIAENAWAAIDAGLLHLEAVPRSGKTVLSWVPVRAEIGRPIPYTTEVIDENA